LIEIVRDKNGTKVNDLKTKLIGQESTVVRQGKIFNFSFIIINFVFYQENFLIKI
jgi:hypothetical protein